MSGAAANAAARRRRLAPQPTSSQTRPQNTSTQSPLLDESTNRTQTSKPVTYLDLLKQHESRLNKIEESQTLVSPPSGTNVLNSQDNSLQELIHKLSERLDRLELSFKTSESHVDSKSELLELKELILKTQSFAMETNLSLMKMQNFHNETANVDNDTAINLHIEINPDNEADNEADVDEGSDNEADNEAGVDDGSDNTNKKEDLQTN